MTADKHPADALAKYMDCIKSPHAGPIAAMLRHIPLLEAANHQLHALIDSRTADSNKLRTALDNARAGESGAQMAVDAAVLAEREACAKLCDDYAKHWRAFAYDAMAAAAESCAESIRAGKEGGAA